MVSLFSLSYIGSSFLKLQFSISTSEFEIKIFSEALKAILFKKLQLLIAPSELVRDIVLLPASLSSKWQSDIEKGFLSEV